MQPTCKPGSVFRRIGTSAIYLDLSSPTSSCSPPPGIGRAALKAGVHDLTTHQAYSPVCRHTDGELLPRLFTLTAPKRGGRSLLRCFALANNFPLGSMAPCVARTFL